MTGPDRVRAAVAALVAALLVVAVAAALTRIPGPHETVPPPDAWPALTGR